MTTWNCDTKKPKAIRLPPPVLHDMDARVSGYKAMLKVLKVRTGVSISHSVVDDMLYAYVQAYNEEIC